MHEKLVKQLRNTEHCCECPYDKDCNEFDSCLMDLLAADAIEDMSKRITRQERELQEKDKYILEKYNEGLIALSGCLAGEVARALQRNDYEEAKSTAKWYKEIFGEDNFKNEIIWKRKQGNLGQTKQYGIVTDSILE